MSELTNLKACIESDKDFEVIRKAILKTPEFALVMSTIREIAKDSHLSVDDTFTYIHYGMNAIHNANKARRKAERAMTGIDILAPFSETTKSDDDKEASKTITRKARKSEPAAPAPVQAITPDILAQFAAMLEANKQATLQAVRAELDALTK